MHLPEARNVLGSDDLRVFDTPAVVGGGGFVTEHLGIRVKHDAVAAVADGVRADLQAAAAGLAHQPLELVGRGHQQAAVAVLVAVVLDQRRAAAAERTVGIELERAHVETAAGVVVGAVLAQPGERVGIAVGHRVDAQRQVALVGQALEGAQLLQRHAGVVHAGQAARDRVLRGRGEHALGGGVVERRHLALDQADGTVHEDAGRLALGVADDLPALGLPVAVERARAGLQRGAVGPVGVAVDALDPHRAIGEGGVEVGGGRELLHRPVVLVPAATEQPLAGAEVLLEGL